jgi:predicted RNase H-like HicB family nuclease
MRYPVVIHKDPDSDYGVTVPDVPGCFSAGETLDEALAQAAEAIECHIEGLMFDGESIPIPHDIQRHHDDPNYADGIWALVDVDLSKLSGKTRRVNITLPERVLTIMDNYASRQGETRSGLIAQATLEFIATHSEAAPSSMREAVA